MTFNHPIIFYDGCCGLCNSTVNFIIEHDKREIFRFSPLQSEFAEKFIINNNNVRLDYSTVILFIDGLFYVRSAALFKILSKLKSPWYLLSFAKVFPKNLCDKLYDFISANRSRLFENRDKCLISDQRLRRKIIL